MKLGGVIVPLATPLTRDRAPDLAAFRRLLSHLLQAGVHGIFANGSMGAFALMSDAGQCAVVEAAAEHVPAGVPLLAGVSDTGLNRVLEKIRRFDRPGVDAFVALPPFYYSCQQRELLRFFLTLADAAPNLWSFTTTRAWRGTPSPSRRLCNSRDIRIFAALR